MASISSGLFYQELTAYSLAWENCDPQKESKLFSADASYRETPFYDPTVGRDAIYQYWHMGAESSQTEITLS